MRVLVLATDCYGCNGGIAQYTRDLIQALAEMPGASEIVVLPRSCPAETHETPPGVHLLPAAAGGKARFILASIWAARRNFDLVVCGHINLLPLAVVLNKRIRAPMVLMVYGIDVWEEPARAKRRFLEKVTAIWSISAVTRDRMNAWAGLPDSRYSILPNAIHLDRYTPGEARKDLQEQYGLGESKVIMTLARLSAAERYKGIDEILDTLPSLLLELPDLKYVIAGDGDDRQRLEQKVIGLGLTEAVVFTGYLEEDTKADVLRLADAFVMPGRGEGFGFVFLEAMACGVPVIGSKVDGSREALRDGRLGILVDPDDQEEITQGILLSLTKRREVPEGVEYFSWPLFKERVSQALRPLTNR